MTRYYKKYYMPASTLNPSNKVYLSFTDIYTIHLSTKLFYWYLGPYNVKKWVSLMSYRLNLSLFMKRLYLVLNIVKLTTISGDPISSQNILSPPDPIIMDIK